MSDPSSLPPGTPPDRAEALHEFWRLVEIVARLRAPDGCPWDRVQTLRTIRPHTLEEAYEVLDAIDAGDDPALCEELGDLLLQVILYAQIAADERRFDLVPVLRGIADKLVRRHPHVFGTAHAETAAQVVSHWEQAKRQEKTRGSAIEGIPQALPALARGIRLVSKGVRAGAAAPTVDPGLLDSVVQRLAQPTPTDPAERERLERDLGDLLLDLAWRAKQHEIHAEDALRAANTRFADAFLLWEQQQKAAPQESRDA